MIDIIALAQEPFYAKLLYVVVVIVLTIVAAILVNRALRRSYEKSANLHKKLLKQHKATHLIEKTKFNMFRRLIVAIILLVGVLMILWAFPELKKISYSIFAGAGVLALIIGFATQEMFSNLVAGVFISFFEPFRIEDRVTIGEDEGYVEDITLWHTIIRTFNNQRVMIPNSIIAKEKIENNTIIDEKTMNYIDFGISYDSDIDLARKIISEEVEKNPHYRDFALEHKYLAKEEKYLIRVISHGDFSIGLRLYVWTDTSSDGFKLKTQLFESVKKRFDKEGVEIPFPYRTIVEKKLQPKNKRLKK